MKLHGIFLPHEKGTENSETIAVPLPSKVKISMSQSMGAPCDPLVKKGDRVLVGQKIGDSDKFMSAPVHSSVSGTVTAVSDMLLANGRTCKAVEIETDGEQEVSPDVKPPVVTDKESLCKAVRESGCVGLGGAGFPTHIKLNYNEAKGHVDSLVINGAECEPYITSDYRTMIEDADAVIDGIRIVKDTLKIEKCYIGIEDNKPEAIMILQKKAAEYNDIAVVRLKSSYPQGAEKVLAFNTTGRMIAEGQLPSDQGIIVMNVSTAAFISSYIKTGMPLVTRRLTIDGDIVKTPCNVSAPIGTPYSELLKFAEANMEFAHKIISGGPMMGMCVYDVETPLCKTNNAILAFKKPLDDGKKGKLKVNAQQTNCIKCGRCIAACPLGLMPQRFEKAFDRKDKETLLRLKINLCMNCGACSYVCPAKRDLAEKNQLAKQFAMQK